jgi:hypothetical protein
VRLRDGSSCTGELPAIAATTTAAAAATASAITPIATAATTTTAAGTFRLGPGFVHVDGASANLRAVERGDCFLAVFVAGHFYESETAGAACVTIGHDANAIHLSVPFKNLSQFFLAGIEAKVPYKNVLHASSSALSCRKCELDADDLRTNKNKLAKSCRSWLQVECGGQYSK